MIHPARFDSGPSVDPRPDYEQALEPLSERQTQEVVRLLIDAYYGGPQSTYHDTDRAHFHALLGEVTDAS